MDDSSELQPFQVSAGQGPAVPEVHSSTLTESTASASAWSLAASGQDGSLHVQKTQEAESLCKKTQTMESQMLQDVQADFALCIVLEHARPSEQDVSELASTKDSFGIAWLALTLIRQTVVQE
uniref:Uncharacterized protein n=1 Tax=Chromera velia CCMP2878 TaxID=1169474 RepID=A0A0G4HDS8_9ALVE|eukprot:Cvel_6434.t1-p1 / transcript=Cvel_6434.t1 / gene=Cvel_6434 / organism=Chromera_velia_CCMP2878 / gene_product=hypothetical protein / transcript_product=hypothetical protein / location=Cvel_scaffold315:19887-21607(+) / protein_length=122 / sequence_SO=supercontig / SO=protein_coding / is_pseudo=false